MKPLAILIIFLLCVAGSYVADAKAQTPIVSGTVADQTGAVIPGTKITFIGEHGKLETFTDSEGWYQLKLTKGTYKMSASKNGFRDVTRPPINVGFEVPVVVDFVLFPKVIRTIEEVDLATKRAVVRDVSDNPFEEMDLRICGGDASALTIRYGVVKKDGDLMRFKGFNSTIHYQQDGSSFQATSEMPVTVFFANLELNADEVFVYPQRNMIVLRAARWLANGSKIAVPELTLTLCSGPTKSK